MNFRFAGINFHIMGMPMGMQMLILAIPQFISGKLQIELIPHTLSINILKEAGLTLLKLPEGFLLRLSRKAEGLAR